VKETIFGTKYWLMKRTEAKGEKPSSYAILKKEDKTILNQGVETSVRIPDP
jgi:hypothetical protein